MTGKKLFVILPLLLLPFLILMKTGKESASLETLPAAVSPVGEEIIPVSTVLPVRGTVERILELTGDVRARDEVDVYPETQGKIRDIRVEPGDYVLKDEVLALVDPSRPGMNYALSPVKAAISGTVTSVFGERGGVISPSVPLCRIGTLSDLEIESFLPERHILTVRPGLTGTVTSPVLPDLREPVRVVRISPVVDPSTRSLRIILAPRENSALLKAGMFVDLTLVLEQRRDVLLVPADALVNRENRDYLYAVDADSRCMVLAVSTGIRQENSVEIREGLTGTERIIIGGRKGLLPGTPVSDYRQNETLTLR